MTDAPPPPALRPPTSVSPVISPLPGVSLSNPRFQYDPAVDPPRPRLTFRSMLTKTHRKRPQGKKKVVRRAAEAGPARFWVRPGHPDLDRAGDLLLAGTEVWRGESVSRGPAP